MSPLKKIKIFSEKHSGIFVLLIFFGSPILLFLLAHLLLWIEPKKLYKIRGEIIQVKRIETVTYWTYDINHTWADTERRLPPAIVTEKKEAPFINHYKIDPILPFSDKGDYGLLLSRLVDMSLTVKNWNNDWNSWDRKKLPLPEHKQYNSLIEGRPLRDNKNYIGCKVDVFYLKGRITGSIYKPIVDISMCKEPSIFQAE